MSDDQFECRFCFLARACPAEASQLRRMRTSIVNKQGRVLLGSGVLTGALCQARGFLRTL